MSFKYYVVSFLFIKLSLMSTLLIIFALLYMDGEKDIFSTLKQRISLSI